MDKTSAFHVKNGFFQKFCFFYRCVMLFASLIARLLWMNKKIPGSIAED